MRTRIKKLIAVTVMALLLASCSSYSSGKPDFYAGETLTPEGVEWILAAISEKEAAVTEKYSPTTDEAGDTVLFWSGSGKVWHISRECPSLKRSTNIKSGNKAAAEAEGKERVCSVCGKGAKNNE